MLDCVLGELVGLLDAQGMPYAVVGGLTASARGEARFTRDIDVALMVDKDGQAGQCIHGFDQQGYVAIATVAPRMRATATNGCCMTSAVTAPNQPKSINSEACNQRVPTDGFRGGTKLHPNV